MHEVVTMYVTAGVRCVISTAAVVVVQEAEVIALPRIIVKRWRDAGVDILVNNAGMGRNDASLMDGNTASWVEMVSTNTLGVCMCTREAVQVLFCKIPTP